MKIPPTMQLTDTSKFTLMGHPWLLPPPAPPTTAVTVSSLFNLEFSMVTVGGGVCENGKPLATSLCSAHLLTHPFLQPPTVSCPHGELAVCSLAAVNWQRRLGSVSCKQQVGHSKLT